MRRALILVCVAAACGPRGGPRKPAKPSRLALVRTVLEPLDIRDASSAPDRGLILGTDKRGGSTLVPLVGQATTLALPGGVSITTSPAAGGLSILPEPAPAAWRHAAWSGAIAAAGLLGKDVGDVHWIIDASAGPESTPVGGGAVAASIVAALTGATLARRSLPALGLIHPDGTIGVQRITDVLGAYTRITGETLPAPVALPAADLRVGKEAGDRLRSAYEPWRRKLAGRWARVIDIQTEGRVPAALTELARRADIEATAAEKLRQTGDVAGAHVRIARAATLAETAVRGLDIVHAVRDGKRADAGALLDAAVDVDRALAAAFETAGSASPTSIGGHLEAVSALEGALAAWARFELARPSIDGARAYLAERQTNPKPDDIAARTLPAISLAAEVRAAADLVAERARAETIESRAFAIDPGAADKLAAPYVAAASAAIELAGDAGARTPAAAVLRFGGAAGLALQIRDRWRDAPLRLSLLTLAGALLAHAGSARLLVERALPTEPGPRDAALSRLVTAAERKARQHARAARIAIGFVPMQARLRYEQALAVRPADRALALELLWTSSLYSQIAIALARNPGPGDRRALAHSADALGRPARECARPEGSAQ